MKLTKNYTKVTCWVWERVEMCQAFQTLRSNNIATARSLVLLFMFSAIKEPAKELTCRLSFTLGEKYVNKIFLLFSGSESAEVSPN